MLRERVGLLEVVEEATVDERHEHARSGKPRLHHLPLLVGEVRFRCHLPQYRSTLIARHVDRGAGTRLPGRGSRRLSERKIQARTTPCGCGPLRQRKLSVVSRAWDEERSRRAAYAD